MPYFCDHHICSFSSIWVNIWIYVPFFSILFYAFVNVLILGASTGPAALPALIFASGATWAQRLLPLACGLRSCQCGTRTGWEDSWAMMAMVRVWPSTLSFWSFVASVLGAIWMFWIASLFGLALNKHVQFFDFCGLLWIHDNTI